MINSSIANAAPELIAILRGLQPERADEIGSALFNAGIRTVEVPLNSPQPYASIRQLTSIFGKEGLCGAGTVLSAEDVRRTYDCGGRLIVAPNSDEEIIECALKLNMRVLPGVATPTEAFAALRAGATELKLFPASSLGISYLKSLKEVLPGSTKIFAVGGIGPKNMQAWRDAGAAGFGIGSELFRNVFTTTEVAQRAALIVRSCEDLR